jgi:hypothetical protein
VIRLQPGGSARLDEVGGVFKVKIRLRSIGCGAPLVIAVRNGDAAGSKLRVTRGWSTRTLAVEASDDDAADLTLRLKPVVAGRCNRAVRVDWIDPTPVPAADDSSDSTPANPSPSNVESASKVMWVELAPTDMTATGTYVVPRAEVYARHGIPSTLPAAQ